MDNYTVDPIILDGGLDFVNAKAMVKPGTLVDCLNYEVVDRAGYQRIEGVEKFDGTTALQDAINIGAIEDETVYTTFMSSVGSTWDVVPGDILVNSLSPTVPRVVVVEVELTATPPGSYSYSIVYWPISGNQLVFEQSYHPIGEAGEVAECIDASVSSVIDLPLAVINTNLSTLRDDITYLPEQIVGLHWFRDREYAVAEDVILYFNSGGTTPIVLFDYIKGQGAGATGRVVNVVLLAGTWAGGDAEGFLQIEDYNTGVWTFPDVIDRVESDFVTVLTANAATHDEASSLADPAAAVAYPKNATLWQARSEAQATAESADAGWSRIDLGVIIEFEDGDIVDGAFPHIDRRTQAPNVEYGTDSTSVTGTNGIISAGYVGFNFNGDQPRTIDTNIFAHWPAGGIVYSQDSDDFVTVLAAEENPTLKALLFQTVALDSGATTYTDRVGLTGVSTLSTIPGYAVITGVEVYLDNVVGPAEAAAGNKYSTWDTDVSLLLYNTTSPTQLGVPRRFSVTNKNGEATGTADMVLGGSTDLWGNTILSLDDVLNANFGISLKTTVSIISGADSGVGTTAHQFTVDRIRIKVYYKKQFTRYYFWNGANDVSADMIDYNLWSGDLTLGTGVGDAQLTNIQTVGVSERDYISVGDEIHLAAGGGAGTLVGVVTSVEANHLPGLAEILENESKYMFITANFYGDDEWDAFFGANGAGRAFSYDGTYFVQIYTQEDATKDMPRHIAYHHFHLALGFSSGSVQFSVVGEPENFDPEFAKEISVGDKITGMQSLRGSTLGVFCENSIWGIIGTDSEQFTTQVLAPNTGAIEYTIVDIGLPIYCDARGIATLTQSEKYGDFQGTRISANITPWLRPRLRRGTTQSQGVVAAVPVRSKNQVRYFFEDGVILTLTLVGGEMEPQFTWQKYLIGASTVDDLTRYIVPIAWSSAVDEDGKDRVHIAHYSTSSSLIENQFVYELDVGWSFAGNFIPAYFTTNWNHASSPMTVKLLRKALLEGLSRGHANIVLQTAEDWSGSFTTFETDLSLPRTEITPISDEFVNYSNINSLATRGRVISLRLTNSPQGATAAEKLIAAEPSHLCQVLILGFMTEGQIVR